MTDCFHFQIRASTNHRVATYKRSRGFIACNQWIPSVVIGSTQIYPIAKSYPTQDKALAAANRFARKIWRKLLREYSAPPQPKG